MPKQAAKRKQPGHQQNPSKNAQSPSIPPPFTQTPKSLDSFLSALDPALVYVVHTDTLPWQFKRKIFTVPILLNVGIVLLICWRLYMVLPMYLNLLMVSMGLPSPETVDKSDKSNKQLGGIVLRRAGVILFDFVLFRYIGAWPFMFFFEQPVSPALWRWRLGYRDSEVYVRVSRKWGAKEFWESTASNGAREITPANPILRERILPAVNKEWIRTRTGYMMMNSDYDLDFPAMLDAERMIEKAEAKPIDFSTSVFIYLDGIGWCLWRIEDEMNPKAEVNNLDEEAARKRMITLKDYLANLGKERLFYRLIELLQYESEQPQGISVDRQEELVQKARDLFSQEGINFNDLMASIGGIQGFPGLGGPS